MSDGPRILNSQLELSLLDSPLCVVQLSASLSTFFALNWRSPSTQLSERVTGVHVGVPRLSAYLSQGRLVGQVLMQMAVLVGVSNRREMLPSS